MKHGQRNSITEEKMHILILRMRLILRKAWRQKIDLRQQKKH